MNKIVIPAILVATILITGFFAFMPIDEAITVHTTIQASIGEGFRVSSGVQLLGTVGGDSTFTLSCSSDCIVESIHGWTGSATEDGDVVFVRNIKGVVNVLEADISPPSNGALGDIAVGIAQPSNITDLLKMIQSAHNVTGTDQSTVETISIPGGGTIIVTVQNSIDVDNDATFVVVFTGKNLGLTTPTFVFAQ